MPLWNHMLGQDNHKLINAMPVMKTYSTDVHVYLQDESLLSTSYQTTASALGIIKV